MEPALLWVIRIGIWSLLFIPLVVTGNLFFPYVTGKNFFFRIVVEIITGAWLALLLIRPALRPKTGLLLWTFVGFVGALVLATILGVDPYHSFWSDFERMEGLITHLHLVLLFLVASSVLRRESDWYLVFHISVGASFLVAIVGLLERAGALVLGGSVGGSEGAGRIFSTLGNPIYLANYLLFHFFLIGYLFWRAWQHMREHAYYLWLSAVYTLVFLIEIYVFFAAGTRGASLGFLAGVGALAILLILGSHNRSLRITASVSLLFLGIVVGAFLAGKNTAFIQSRPLLARLSDISLSSSTVQSRFMVWGMAWDGFKERPLLGWGPENFIVPFTKYYRPDFYGNEPWFDRVHNMYLEWLVAGGVVGFFAYLALVGAVFWSLARLWRRGIFDLGAFALFTALFVAYLTHNFFVFDTIVSYLIVTLLLAFLHSMSSQDKESFSEEWLSLPRRAGTRSVVSLGIVLVGIVAALLLNFLPLTVAAGIINTLEVAESGGPPSAFIDAYKETVERGTFGAAEARERLVEFTLQATLGGQLKEVDAALLLQESITAAEELQGQFSLVRYQLNHAKLRQLRFILFRDENDRDAALELYLLAHEKAPRYPPSSLGLAELYLVIGNNEEAREIMDDIFSQVTRQNILFRSIILVYAHTGDFDGAIRWMEHFIRLGPRTSPSYIGLDEAEAFAKRSLLARDAGGRERFLQMLKNDMYLPDNATILLALAETEAELGKKEEARTYAARARELQPNWGADIDRFLERL